MGKIPYEVSDFKPGDLVHVIGEFDDVMFDDVGTVITTNKLVPNPFNNDDDSILLRFDDKTGADFYVSHDGETENPEISKACKNKCWWIWEWQWNAEKNNTGYYADKKNHIIKLNAEFPNAYDIISSLDESEIPGVYDVKKFINNLEVGDKIIVSFEYRYHDVYRNAEMEIAEVIELDPNPDGSKAVLLLFQDWHDGHYASPDLKSLCQENKCFWLVDNDTINIKYINYYGLPAVDLTDVFPLNENYYSKDLFSFGKEDSAIISFVYLDGNGNFEEVKNEMVTFLNSPNDELHENWRLVLFKDWHKGHHDYDARCYPRKCYFITDNDITNNFRDLVIMSAPYIGDIFESTEGGDFDWAEELTNEILKSTKLLVYNELPRTNDNKTWHLITFGKLKELPEKKYDAYYDTLITDVINFVEKESFWHFKNPEHTIQTLKRYLKDFGLSYISLKPIPVGMMQSYVGFGGALESFSRVNNKNINDPDVNIIEF
jgi:hypothetical protein